MEKDFEAEALGTNSEQLSFHTSILIDRAAQTLFDMPDKVKSFKGAPALYKAACPEEQIYPGRFTFMGLQRLDSEEPDGGHTTEITYYNSLPADKITRGNTNKFIRLSFPEGQIPEAELMFFDGERYPRPLTESEGQALLHDLVSLSGKENLLPAAGSVAINLAAHGLN